MRVFKVVTISMDTECLESILFELIKLADSPLAKIMKERQLEHNIMSINCTEFGRHSGRQ